MWHPDIPKEWYNQIVTGDAKELSKLIPDESVDLIFTDPVYDQIDDYAWLAETAARVLKNDGHILVWQSVRNIFTANNALSPYLFYRYTFSLSRSNACRGTVKACIYSLWTPLLWYSKIVSTPVGIRARDSMDVPMIAGDKSKHKWQKPEKAITYWLKCFSKEYDIIFDPFTGGGTVPAVCKMLGRNYLAFEIDPETADQARQRVANTQPPLTGFVIPEQLEIDLDH